ncbi:hypothetical protein [Sandaracinus amylolyticus]|uniref:Uncharacterized protein n=1 Tax=Sandaracinus amylolyticus TaxID=927083 RepID=A0A0F6YH11_9BACT|nr:hypothetical protein [Sandaracinus amylolyticus]AKF05313.1 hypothetical protein DB32_002462 [Sandaracinus amylolyticus]
MDRYDVILQAIDEGVDREQAVHAAGVVLGLDPRGAKRALDVLPAKVLEDVDERSAEELLAPLRRAGWRVRLLKRPLRRGSYPSPHGLQPASRHPSSHRGLQPASRPSPYPPPSTPPAVSSWPPAPGSSASPSEPAALEAPLLPLPELDLDLPPAAPAPRRSAPPASSPPPVAPAATEEPEGESLVTFFASLPRTLLTPLRGGALRWLLRTVLLAIGFVLLATAGTGLLLMRSYTGLSVSVLGMLAGSAFWIGHLFSWFRACLWAVLGREEGPDPPPDFDGDDLYARVFDGAVVIVAFVVPNVGLLLSGASSDPTALAAGELPMQLVVANLLLAVHVPIGLTLMATRHSRLAYFDVLGAIKLVIGAPIHLIVVLAVWAFVTRVAGAGVLAMALGATAAAEAGAPAALLWVGLPVAGLVLLVLTMLQWGVLGAAMGAVCRAKPRLVAT